MLIEQIIEVESRVPGLLVVHIPKTRYFLHKTKIFKGESSSEWFNAKNLQKAMYLDSHDQAKSQNLIPKWKILNVIWTWVEVKRGICSIGFQISTILFFQMTLKTCEMWSKWH